MTDNTLRDPWGYFVPNGLQSWAIAQSNQRPKTLWGSLCRRLVLSGLRRPLDVERYGARLRLHPLDNLCEKRALLAADQWDTEERSILREHSHPEFRFVDIGANIGLYSLLVAAFAGPGANVLAVEPQPKIKQRLLYNLSINPGLQIKHVDCAVSKEKGMARMGVSSKNRGASGFALRSGVVPDDEFVVQTSTLGELLHSHNMQGADALKIDIEGAEEQVLPDWLEQTAMPDLPSLLIVERNPDWSIDCIELALRRGYRILAEAHMNVVLKKTQLG